jgi:hypothetical protein
MAKKKPKKPKPEPTPTPKPTPIQEFLTVTEAAALLDVGPQRLRDLERYGEIRCVGKTGKGWRLFTRESVERLRKQREGVKILP